MPLLAVMRRARREVERPAPHVGHAATGLGHDEEARGVVPDVLHVAAARQPQVDRGITASHDRVLRLAVQAKGLGGDAQELADAHGGGLVRVGRLDRFRVPTARR